MKTIEELKNSIVDINYIIENMIRENGLYCLLGEAKVGKSALALQIANSVCNGIPFLNLNTNKTSVLYLSTEMNPSETISRINFMECNLEENKFLYTFPEDNMTHISILKVEKEISEFKEKYNGKLVFIDMFNGINFGSYYDLNNYQDMSQKIFPQLRKLCNDYKVSIIIVHHLNRKGKSLGSTAIDTCVDGKLALKQDENIKSTLYLSYESRDYPSKDYVLKRTDNLTLIIDEESKETLNPNLIQFLKYAINKKEFTFTISEMVSKLNLFITPPVLGKLISSNKEELERLGLFIECKRTATERLYTAKYKEPLEMLTNDIFSVSNSNNSDKEENYGS